MEKRRQLNIRPSALALLEGIFGLTFGLVVGILAWIGSDGGFNLNTSTVLQGLMFGMPAGLISTLAAALGYAAAGVISGLAHGWLYNMLSPWVSRTVESPSEADYKTTESGTGTRYEPTFGETIGTRKRHK